MEISRATVLTLTLVLISSTTTTQGFGLGNIIGGLTNLTSPLIGNTLTNLTAPILGNPSAQQGNASSTNGGGLDLPDIISPFTNLTNGVVTGVLNLTNNIVGPITNVKGGVIAGLSPVLSPIISNVTRSLNLTNVVGSLSNITGPLVDILANLSGPASNVSISTNITVSVSLNLPPTSISNPTISFPSSLTIVPLGLTEVSFMVYTQQGINASTIPITFMVPVLSYLNFPVSGSAQVTVDFPLGSTLSVIGITNSISRMFFGVSWQTFPQLTSVIISKLLPGGSHQEQLYALEIPALMCKASIESFISRFLSLKLSQFLRLQIFALRFEPIPCFAAQFCH
ncbi:unnamed protein product [Calypogeia fissa]